MSNALMVPETGLILPRRQLEWNPNEKEVAIVRNSICVGANTTQLAYFLNVAKTSALNPIKKQICMLITKKKVNGQYQEVVHAYTTLDGYRVIAHRSGRLDGIYGLQWGDENGHWYDNLPADAGVPFAARAHVAVKGCSHPFVIPIYWEEFGKDAAAKGEWSTWAKMPRHMLMKTAQIHALRLAFPDDIQGLETEEELTADHDMALAMREWAQAQARAAAAAAAGENGEEGQHEPAQPPKRTTRATGNAKPPLKVVDPEPVSTPPAKSTAAAKPTQATPPAKVAPAPPKPSPAPAQGQAKAKEPAQDREDVAYLKQLLGRMEDDGGEISWSRVRTTISTIDDVPGQGPIDFNGWSQARVQKVVDMYESIEEEEKAARARTTTPDEDWQDEDTSYLEDVL